MSFKPAFAFLAAALAFAGSAAASPIGNAALEARDYPPGNLYVCTDANWGGHCDNIWFAHEQCVTFPGDFQNDISSIGPPQQWYCYGYTNYNCGDDFIDFQYPGIYDLGDGNTAFNDRLNSFVCYHAAGGE
ncbi:hypothetical protein PsYK624_034250 [Phanerochaete sordida]|uniref:Uncharacterized protein n=1 Tax=Phanerochaete sordida TaxID=48140 RepID=A0A9P3LB06_9APHY|nr:hypothetical protein PsYK624_034250 [Phanerochaete sordida]